VIVRLRFRLKLRVRISVRVSRKTTESIHCTITGPYLRMHHIPSARTLQHVTVPIRNIYRVNIRVRISVRIHTDRS